MRTHLTATAVERISAPTHGRLDIFDERQRGLVLRITSRDTRTYAVRARIKGDAQPKWVRLGDARTIKLADARDQAADILKVLQKGIDPRAEERAKIEEAVRERVDTFENVVEEFIKKRCAKLRSGDAMAKNMRRHLVTAWRKRHIASITADDVAQVIGDLVERGVSALARLTLAHAKTFFRWAAAPGRSYITVNPCANLSAKDFDIKPTIRQVVLPSDHLRLYWQATDKLAKPFGDFYKMLLLCGQRRTEVARMRVNELDLKDEKVWIIPAERMKGKRPHEVPLTPAMIKLLRSALEGAGEGPYVFSTTRGRSPIAGFSKSKKLLDKTIAGLHDGKEPLRPWRLHDLRRTMRTALGAMPSVPHDVRELVIAHIPPVLAKTYDLHDYRNEKRNALKLWSDRLLKIVGARR